MKSSRRKKKKRKRKSFSPVLYISLDDTLQTEAHPTTKVLLVLQAAYSIDFSGTDGPEKK